MLAMQFAIFTKCQPPSWMHFYSLASKCNDGLIPFNIPMTVIAFYLIKPHGNLMKVEMLFYLHFDENKLYDMISVYSLSWSINIKDCWGRGRGNSCSKLWTNMN